MQLYVADLSAGAPRVAPTKSPKHNAAVMIQSFLLAAITQLTFSCFRLTSVALLIETHLYVILTNVRAKTCLPQKRTFKLINSMNTIMDELSLRMEGNLFPTNACACLYFHGLTTLVLQSTTALKSQWHQRRGSLW